MVKQQEFLDRLKREFTGFCEDYVRDRWGDTPTKDEINRVWSAMVERAND